MPGQTSAVAILFLSLVGILYGYQVREKEFPKVRGYLQYTATATEQTITKPPLQLINQTFHVTLAERSKDDYIQMAVETSTFENTAHLTMKTAIPVTTKSLLPISSATYNFVRSNNSHIASSSTEDTIGSGSIAHLPIPTIRASLATVNHITGRTTQLGDQTTLLKTFFTASHKSTTSQRPTLSTNVSGTSPPTHKYRSTTSPVPLVPRPTLLTWASPAKIGTYEVLNGSRLCIKAEMGITLIVQEKDLDSATQRNFNIDPSLTHAFGKCGFQKSNLFLNFQGGSVNVTFTKDENLYYISEVGAYLTISNTEKTYQGKKNTIMMFETVVGHSFKCVSEQSIQLSAQLQMKTMNIHLQAFDFAGDSFGNVDECLSDYRVAFPVVAIIMVVLCVVGLGVYKIRQRYQSSGYQRI
ncbi:lysosome-associated membrane glycoprotein 3 [Grammomys surdaster]|uniref:lysosome-associated membrane glycoprotein 3 n=1 Tax=Grammomys surdaster TaxID=491861 RepID=UPI00109FDAD7|nr:lysosome-associated membrane glycoprotein 3 [Grammomys surdaster]